MLSEPLADQVATAQGAADRWRDGRDPSIRLQGVGGGWLLGVALAERWDLCFSIRGGAELDSGRPVQLGTSVIAEGLQNGIRSCPPDTQETGISRRRKHHETQAELLPHLAIWKA